MKPNRSFLQRIAGWSVLVFVPLLLFAKPIVRGESLVPTDILPVIDDIWAEKVTPKNPLLSDVLLQFYPWQKFAIQSITRGEFPLWNPYLMAGAPFLANDQSAIFEPLKFLTLITRFPAEHSFLFLAVGRLILFGLFTAWWLRVRGFSSSASVVIGAAASLSAPAITWVSYPLFATFLWLPLLLVGLEYMTRRARRGWLVTVGAVAAQWFSGNIQISIFILLFSAAYTLAVLRPRWRQALSLVIAVMLGTSLAAVQLLPTAHYIRQSPVYESGRGGYGETNVFSAIRDGSWRGWKSKQDARKSLERLLPILSPFVNGNPASGKYRFPGGDVYANMNELAGSVGMVTLLFAILGLITSWRERLVKFSASASILALGAMAHAPIFELINTLPLLQQTQTDRLRFVVAFSFLILAAFGLRAIYERRVSWKKWTIISGLLLGVITMIGWKLGIGADWKMELVWSGLGLGAITLAIAMKLSTRWLVGLVGLAVVVGPLLLWQNYNPSINATEKPKTTQLLESLITRRSVDSRIVSFGIGRGRTPLEPNTAMVYDLLDVRGYDVVRLKRYDELVDGVLTRSGSHLKGATKPGEILNSLSVQYGLVATRDIALLDPILTSDGWTMVAEDANVRIYENAKWQPRAWFTTKIQEVPDAAASLRAVRAETFSADIPVIETGKNIPAQGDAVFAPVVTNFSKGNQIVLQVNAPQAGYVVLADAYASGWTAQVDGQVQPILPANHALRAVAVSAGDHELRFEYHPRDFFWGWWLSLSSVAVLGLVFYWARKTSATT